MKLGNISIGKKMGLLIGTSVALVACLTLTGLYSLRAIHSGMVGSNIGGISQRVATMVLTENRSEEHLSELLALRKEYMAAFGELKSSELTEGGKRLVGETEQAATAWREADNRALALLKAGRRAEAARLHDAEIVPRFHELAGAVANYRKYCGERTAEINGRAEALMVQNNLTLVSLGLFFLLGAAVSGVVITRSITHPLSQAVRYLENVANGDLARDVDPENLARKDEIGSLGAAVQGMTNSLRGLIRNTTEGVGILTASSAELSANSGQMSEGEQLVSEKAHAVAAATEEMTANITSVAASMEQTTTNLTSVASATEQMTSTIGEIAGNSEKARRITEEAAHQADRISQQMNQLGQAAHEIGKVTETITEISSQTNLLALNATIEAARAGSAGKGFAVVANEIKELAQQTAAATEDIKGRIAGVQTSTAGGISEIEKISRVIHEVTDIVGSIAAAIEEQATVTKDIARNIGEATTGVRDANVRVTETSQATQDIAKGIIGVDQSTREMAQNSEQVRKSATELSRLAEQLQTSVSRFHVSGGNRMMLKNAIAAHAAWTARLKAAVVSRHLDIPLNTIQADDQCQFGKWLYGKEISDVEKQTEHYRATRRLHAQFHQEAAKVAQLAISGQEKAAEKALDLSSEYAHVSSALTGALNRWNEGA
jgi:methyl-accepting chemotaxis protein